MKRTREAIVNFFIPSNIKANKTLYEKTRIAVYAFLSILIIMPIYPIFYLSKGYVWDIKSIHNYIGISVSLVGLIIIKFTGKPNLALSIVAIIAVYLVTASVYIAGGLQSNDILWYLVLSAASFMFIEERTGFIVSFLCLLGLTFFYLVEVFNFIPLPNDPVALTPTYRYINFTLILSILTAMVYILVRGNNKLQEIIQLSKEQKVREEIARDFHDQIGNKLASLRHMAELVHLNKSETEQGQILTKIDLKAKDVYDNFRDFIWTLDTKSDQLTELFMYIRDFADDYFKFSKINLFINSEPDQLPEVLLPGSYSKEIVPLFKEAITNLQKHSQAKNAYLNFIVSKTELIIKLKDDGKGIDEEYLKNGNGLTNMHYRSQKIGGALHIVSSPSSGTEIIFTILLPLKGSSIKINNS